MPRLRPDFWRFGGIFLLLAALVLAGCGDDEKSTQPPEKDTQEAPDDWSAPEGPQDAVGSPDGDGPKSAAEVLARLRTRIASGEGNSGPSWQQDVEAVAAVLWGEATDPKDTAAAQVHTEVSNISGEVCRWLAASETARAEREKSHPHDVSIHDAQVKTLAQGPDLYKAWCVGEGAKLLTALKEARYKEMFGR